MPCLVPRRNLLRSFFHREEWEVRWYNDLIIRSRANGGTFANSGERERERESTRFPFITSLETEFHNYLVLLEKRRIVHRSEMISSIFQVLAMGTEVNGWCKLTSVKFESFCKNCASHLPKYVYAARPLCNS